MQAGQIVDRACASHSQKDRLLVGWPVADDGLEYADDLEEVVKLNIAFKTIHILGQFVRNFPGSLDSELKKTIVEECYSLGLRALSAVLGLTSASLPDLREYFAELAKDKRALLSNAEATRVGDGVVLWLARGCAFGVVKKVSNAVGLEDLAQTFQAVLERNRTTATVLIDVSVKLDHFPNVPPNEIKELGREVRKSYFTSILLRDLVRQHLLVFEVSTKERQRLLSWLGIEGPTPELFDNPRRRLKGG